MKMYWNVNAIPELQAIPVSLRKEVWKLAFRQAQRGRSGQKALLTMVLIAAGISGLGALLVDWKPVNLAITMGSVFVAIIVYMQMLSHAAIPHIASIFAKHYHQQ